jgi:GT2 family glycosyltransferase
MPMFSVIIPTYNRAAFVVRAIESVRAQTFTDYEIIVVDDGSTDDTADCVAATGVRYIPQTNQGPGVARNRGITEARGTYCTFLDSDDWWPAWTLTTYAKVLHQRPCAFITAPTLNYQDGTTPQLSDSELDVELAADYFSSDRTPLTDFTTISLAIRSDVLRESGGFVTERMNFEDLDLWFKLGTAPGFAFVRSPVCAARTLHAGNVHHRFDLNNRGAMHMIASEKSGTYPGGDARRRDRRERLTFMMRSQSLQMLKHGNVDGACAVYRATFGWNLAAGRMRYLLGFPYLMLCRKLRRSGVR